MNDGQLFRKLGSAEISDLIRSAQQSVCYAAPGIQMDAAQAIVEAGARLGLEMLTVCLDFGEHVIRMGYGDVCAVKMLRNAGISVSSVAGLRTALVIADNTGFIFTPTALYLEPGPTGRGAPNAIRMSTEQTAEALARLSPAAKAIAVARAKTSDEKKRIHDLPLDVGSDRVSDARFEEVNRNLEKAPPVRFDLARQVRVFEPYLQYVELSLMGAAIQRHRLAIPAKIQKLGGSEELERRLRTTFELIEKGSKLSSKPLDDALKEIRKNFTPSLGNDGRVVLKAQRQRLDERLAAFRKKLEAHQKTVAAELQRHLDESREQIVSYYLPRVIENPPDELFGQLLSPKPSTAEAQQWLNRELDRVFPNAESLVEGMVLFENYKDVTFETLNRKEFLESVKAAFPAIDWDKTYEEFKAAGEGVSVNPGEAQA